MRTRCDRFSSASGLNPLQSPPGQFASIRRRSGVAANTPDGTMVFALALTSQLAAGFLAPTGVGKQVEARTGQVSCLLGRRQVATSAALLALGSYAGEAQASGTKLSLEEQA